VRGEIAEPSLNARLASLAAARADRPRFSREFCALFRNVVGEGDFVEAVVFHGWMGGGGAGAGEGGRGGRARHSPRLLFNNAFVPVWPSPRRMTEHNGSTDVFKSDKGVWRAHPPSPLPSAAHTLSLSLSLSPVLRSPDPRDVPRRSFSNFPPLALRRVRGQVSLPSSHSRFPPSSPLPLYPFFFPLSSLSYLFSSLFTFFHFFFFFF